jgi:hypothetical protein
MSVDGANNHPLLSWGNTDFTPFMDGDPIEWNELTLPLNTIFDKPYPEKYEMADLLPLDTDFAGSEKLKHVFENQKIEDVQYLPIEIVSNKKEKISGHYYLHFQNRLRAIDKDNYEGSEPNRFGNIFTLERFSLNAD